MFGLLKELWSAARTPEEPAGKWVVTYRRQYWNGAKWTDKKHAAEAFPSTAAAWDFVDTQFDPVVADRCDLEPINWRAER